MQVSHIIFFCLMLILGTCGVLLADDVPTKVTDEQRTAITQLPRKLAAARGDAEARTQVIDEAIALGPLGVQRLMPLLQKDALSQLTRYANLFKKHARRNMDAQPATIVASDETLQTMRASLLESGGLLVRLERAAGQDSPDAEQQVATAENQFLREIRLGPILSQLSDLELSAIEETNKQRAAHQLPPLQFDLKLCLAARDHSADMEKHDFFDHTSPVVGKTTFVDRAKRFGTTANGENIHEGSDTGAAAVTAWMNSEGHRANILKTTYRRVGIGHHNGYWTQLFGN